MTVEQLREIVGHEVYQEARSYAWSTAPQMCEDRGPLELTPIYPILDALYAYDWSKTSDFELVTSIIELYREMPSYSLLFWLGIERTLREMDAVAIELYWSFARAMMASDSDALADPMSYHLWCGAFEDGDAAESWQWLTSGAPDLLLQRALKFSSAVPFAEKLKTYEQLLRERRWHHYIFESLFASEFDLKGKIKPAMALRILNQLTLGEEDAENERLLRKRLDS